MALGQVEEGTQSATTDHLLGSGSTTPGVYVCQFNLDAMVDGDRVRCYVNAKVDTGDTAKVAFEATYQHADGGGRPIKTSPPVVTTDFVQCGVEELDSATISVVWKLIRVGEF